MQSLYKSLGRPVLVNNDHMLDFSASIGSHVPQDLTNLFTSKAKQHQLERQRAQRKKAHAIAQASENELSAPDLSLTSEEPLTLGDAP